MPLTYTIDRRLKIVIARASGVLSEEDLRGSREQIQSDPAYHPSFAQLFDLSDVTDIEVSIPVMARIAGSTSVPPGTRSAFVGINDIQYEMARTFATLAEPHHQMVHVFRDRAIAEAWVLEQRADLA